ncbi:hypothetical protein L1987_24078 [Smallanthus sonchifolius]|uniref:Uncharacterized protein n=1 Tax=Smallanthus sonchifolius TaxID=185202 RepID=A0ACB9IIP8_9ASTR|nr:hypothetical protein L1987_24078 [Smallanthus sonchifolius]
MDYGVNLKQTPMFIDNEACVKIVKNPIYHSKTEHIDVRVHAIRDAYVNEYIQVLPVNTNDQKADIFMKAFDKSKFLDLVQKLGSKGGSSYTEGHVGQAYQQSFVGRGHPKCNKKRLCDKLCRYDSMRSDLECYDCSYSRRADCTDENDDENRLLIADSHPSTTWQYPFPNQFLRNSVMLLDGFFVARLHMQSLGKQSTEI